MISTCFPLKKKGHEKNSFNFSVSFVNKFLY
jgi:hypothetical protein